LALLLMTVFFLRRLAIDFFSTPAAAVLLVERSPDAAFGWIFFCAMTLPLVLGPSLGSDDVGIIVQNAA
jgi:hypothetical protein